MTLRSPGRATRAPIAARALAAALAIAAVSLSTPGNAPAARNTPRSWKQIVSPHLGPRFADQRKHLGWIRDRNSNFIDDEIERRFHLGDSVNVLVELNDCIPPDQIATGLSGFGRVTYAGRMVSCAYLKGVPFGLLDSLSALPQVAMIEWQAPIRPILDVSGRAIQAAQSTYYSTHAPIGYARSGGLTGAGINIAILDTGVNDAHNALNGSFVAGFDATIYEDADGDGVDDSWKAHGGGTPAAGDEPGDGSTNPAPESIADHGTNVAGIALGRPSSVACRTPAGETTTLECSGVAPGAGLIDVKVCETNDDCDARGVADGNVMQGIDWVGLNKDNVDHPIRVVNLSLSDFVDDDGTSALCEAVNYLAAIGVVPVVGHGNADCESRAGGCKGTVAGDKITASPAAASYAITVAGTSDQGTVERTDDDLYHLYLRGPRTSPPGLLSDPLGLKPDLAAPAYEIVTTAVSGGDDHVEASGTSFAAPHVAGTVALMLKADDTMDPASVKDVLERTADHQKVAPALWNDTFGAGFLNAYRAVAKERLTDVRFHSCSGPASKAGELCPLASGIPPWDNYMDISTVPDPVVAGDPTTVTAMITNGGLHDADVLVSFGVYVFGVGTNRFEEIGTVPWTIHSGDTDPVSIVWTPEDATHQCIQVHIQYGYDTEYRNNITQRNLDIAASTYNVRVENPYMTPARFHVIATSDFQDWPCVADPPDFQIEGPEDCPRDVRVQFHPPRDARPPAKASCNVAVYAARAGARDSVLIGGVTVETYVPVLCPMVGEVLDDHGRPIKGLTLRFTREVSPGLLRADWERDQIVTTDEAGMFKLKRGIPGAHQTIFISGRDVPSAEIAVQPRCGAGAIRLQLGPKGVRLLR